jgi:predicted nucleic acid-binding protein
MPKNPRVLLIDANVLIDYQKSDFSILGLVNQHVSEVHVLTTILHEVDGLDVVDCERLGLKVIDPELAQVMRASIRKGRLSFRDRLCLVVASEGGLVCVTNDKALREACDGEGVTTLWGLEIMTALVRGRAIQAANAIDIAEKIHVSNPLHVSKKIVERFSRAVNAAEKRSGS